MTMQSVQAGIFICEWAACEHSFEVSTTQGPSLSQVTSMLQLNRSPEAVCMPDSPQQAGARRSIYIAVILSSAAI
ncbi:hypothetical protein [Bradyrhizobium sp. SSUT77]|uniref:hypothetical protein n=1 Tax=Bradyrhizobium sp. SSUT77 TaxID=3040603 RepID=UPI00244AA426|nr:hypothetical protein [Bradyrhizobium sp. SSUT77]MDH2348805.1 hypothetical protein [Bradyrhizobium sp. SSUT77]